MKIKSIKALTLADHDDARRWLTLLEQSCRLSLTALSNREEEPWQDNMERVLDESKILREKFDTSLPEAAS